MNHVILGQYSKSTNNDKEECLKALAIRLLIIALAHQSLFFLSYEVTKIWSVLVQQQWRKTSPYTLRRTKHVLIESGEVRYKKHDVGIWLRLTPLHVIPLLISACMMLRLAFQYHVYVHEKQKHPTSFGTNYMK